MCAIQETKRKGKGQMIIGEYLLIYSGVKENMRAKEERIVRIRIEINKTKLNIVSVYAPENCRSQTIREDFYDKLQEELDKINNNEAIIILGDLNARVGNRVIPGIKQRFNEEVENENGELLTTLCTINELRINNTFYNHKQQHKYTFNNERGYRSTIDYIITNREIPPTDILDIRSLTSADIGSDHNLVMAKIRINPIKKTKSNKETKLQEKIKVEGLSDETTRNLYLNRLEQKILNNSITDEDDVDKAWDKLKTNVTQAAEEALGSKEVKPYNPFGKRTPWFTDEIKQKCKEKRLAYQQYRTERTMQSYRKYKRKRIETHELVRTTKKRAF
ncbi:craniofacial development protein 2-like [Atheta coriaria]|uniref:craniofacial development protein 2-like n=1 Tax=Dalotia coriaria TaxID=877792 RepID=UPI0031F41177